MLTLSLVVPNFNHAAYLPAVVASCFEGQEAADEVLVIDDASTDPSRDVLHRLAARYPRLQVVEHSTNRGPAAALNTGIAAARGDWVLLRAADDLCPTGSLARFRRLAERFPHAGLIAGDLRYFQKDQERGVREHLGRATEPALVDHENYLQRYGGNIIHGASSFVRLDWLREAGGLDANLRWHCDWFLLLALGLKRGFLYAPEVFGAMRLNPQSYNAQGTAAPDGQTRVLTHLVEKLEADPVLLERILACGCLDFFGEPLVRLLRAGDAGRRARFAPLLAKPSPAIFAARNATGLASVFRGFLARNGRQIREHPGRIAIFGAGGHTRQLLAVWRQHDFPPVALILDSSGGQGVSEIDGIPVRLPPSVSMLDRPLVILSSKSYEPLFAAIMEAQVPGVPYLKIWGADDSGIDRA